MTMTLNDFHRQLRNEVLRDAGIDGGEAFVEEAFTRHFLDFLAEAGEIADADVCYYARQSIRVDGYSADENEDTLDLFVTLRIGGDVPERIEKARVDRAFKLLAGFYAKAQIGLHAKMEEVEPAFELTQKIHLQHQQNEGFSRVRLFLLTDGIVNVNRLPDAPELGKR